MDEEAQVHALSFMEQDINVTWQFRRFNDDIRVVKFNNDDALRKLGNGVTAVDFKISRIDALGLAGALEQIARRK